MSELILPPGVDGRLGVLGSRGTIVNESELPDGEVEYAVKTFFEENASVLGANNGTTFQTYAQDGGSLLARSKFRVPGSLTEEIMLARNLADRDDDVGATIGAMLAVAFGDGYQHTHDDEVTAAQFDAIAKEANLDATLNELYREWLIAGQFTTASLFTREPLQFRPQGSDRMRSRGVVQPRVAVIPAEQVAVVGDDTFGKAPLYYRPTTGRQEAWLREYFSDAITPARKAEMRRLNPVLTTLLTGQVEVGANTAWFGEGIDPPIGLWLYQLNPQMVHRSTMPKGGQPYPRPLLTRNFPLLEAKRLLNVLDFSLLEGGSNFLVVAKKGTDTRPALPQEVAGLRDTLRRASRSGVIVGDHRLNIEIITPDLTELLNPGKRRLLGRKLAMAILRLPDFQDSSGASGQGALADIEIVSRVIAADRRAIGQHIERNVYAETAKRNSASFNQGAADIWFPKILLEGAQFFTDMVLKLRDRGDIPRKFAVEAAGFSYQHAVAQRKIEKANGDDRVLTPPPLAMQPGMSGPAGPQDNNGGRPRGTSPDNGRPGAHPGPGPDTARPRQVVTKNAGETVVAMSEGDQSFRVGELTHAITELYADTSEPGRVTSIERSALARISAGDFEPFLEGPLTIIPVNVEEELGDDVRAVRMATGLSMLVASRYDGAVMARALVFRTPEFRPVEAQEMALRWGFDVGPVVLPQTQVTTLRLVEDELAAAPAAPAQEIHFHSGGKVTKRLIKDDEGNIVGVEEEPC